MAEQNTESFSATLLKSAKDFSLEQKLNVVQSIVSNVPQEKQKPWNLSSNQWEAYQSRNSTKLPAITTLNGSIVTSNSESVSEDLFEKETEMKLTQPPTTDPYEKTMRYYEKHLVLNKFQHMTAALALHRPDEAVQYMIDWCRKMKNADENKKFASTTLFEEGKIDVYSEQEGLDSDKDKSAEKSKTNATPSKTVNEGQGRVGKEDHNLNRDLNETLVEPRKVNTVVESDTLSHRVKQEVETQELRSSITASPPDTKHKTEVKDSETTRTSMVNQQGKSARKTSKENQQGKTEKIVDDDENSDETDDDMEFEMDIDEMADYLSVVSSLSNANSGD